MNNNDDNKYIDLHIHSKYSDGTFTPSEIVEAAHLCENLSAIALTDHDSVSGIDEFLQAGTKYPELECISGVEISTMYGNRELHLVGLFIDHHNPELLTFLENLKTGRLERNILMAKKLYSLGYDIDTNILPYHKDDSLGRLHFASYLVNYHGLKDLQEVFDKFLRRGRSAFVERELPLPSDAITAIKNAGGISIWAHPVYRERSNERSFVRRMIRKLVPFGLDGIECYYSMFGTQDTNTLLDNAKLNNLLASGGSDFHGDNRPGINIGVGAGKMHIPCQLLLDMKKRINDLLIV